MPRDVANTNRPDADTIAAVAHEWRQQKRKCDVEKAVMRNIVKRAKAIGVNTEALDRAVTAAKRDPEEVQANLRDQIRYMGIIHIPIEPAAILGEYDIALGETTRQADALWEADELGFRAGRGGVSVADCPFAPGSACSEQWLASWQTGQTAIARELGAHSSAASSERARPVRTVASPLGDPPDARDLAEIYTPGAAPRGRARKRGARAHA